MKNKRKNPETVDIFRFSKNGFQPIYQTRLEEKINYFLNDDIDKYPLHIRRELQKHKIIENWKDYLFGIFCFIGKPDIEIAKHLTNHIKNKKDYRWFKGQVSSNTVVFIDADYILEHKNIREVSEFKHWDNVYIPKQFLKVYNVEVWDENAR